MPSFVGLSMGRVGIKNKSAGITKKNPQ
jgi:hypothetical protein